VYLGKQPARITVLGSSLIWTRVWFWNMVRRANKVQNKASGHVQTRVSDTMNPISGHVLLRACFTPNVNIGWFPSSYFPWLWNEWLSLGSGWLVEQNKMSPRLLKKYVFTSCGSNTYSINWANNSSGKFALIVNQTWTNKRNLWLLYDCWSQCAQKDIYKYIYIYI